MDAQLRIELSGPGPRGQLACCAVLGRRLVIAAVTAIAATDTFAASSDSNQRRPPSVSPAPPAVVACLGCHGQRGEGAGDFPRLAGIGATYLRGQLEAFASGSRKSVVMQPIAQALTPQQRAEAARYFSALEPPSLPARREETAQSPTQLGAWLATRGRWEASIPACTQCHGPAGVGVGQDFPPLGGQPAAYLAAQLKAWQGGERPPGPLGLMQSIAKKLSDADIRAVSDYYAGLGRPLAATPVSTAPSAGARRE